MLADREQFIGHLIHAHEFKDEEARNVWQIVSAKIEQHAEVLLA